MANKRKPNNIPGQSILSCCIPTAVWRPTPVSLLPSWAEAKRVAVDIETDDPQLTTLGPGVRRGAKIIGVSFAIEDGPSHYLPVGHSEDNLDAGHVFDYLRDQSEIYSGDIVGANLPYDLDFLWENRITFPKKKRYLDVQIAEPLIDELQDRYSLEAIAGRYGMVGKNEVLLREAAAAYYVDAKRQMKMLPARFVGPYAIQDTELPLRLMRRQERIIEEQNLGKIFDLETRLLPVLLKMRRRGVRIDQEHLAKVEEWTWKEERRQLDRIYSLTGIAMSHEDVTDAKAWEKVFKAQGIDVPRTATGLPSVNKEFFASLKTETAVVAQRARYVNKIRNTYVKATLRHMVDGRIHCTFKQLRGGKESTAKKEKDDGARFGRLACSDPNLQNQPARDDLYDLHKKMGTLLPEEIHVGKFWRKIYAADEGMDWSANDFSGQEPRIEVHFAELMKLTGAKEIVDAFNADPKFDLHQKTADLSGLPRPRAKIMFLAIAYGAGEGNIAEQLGLPTQMIWSNKWKMMIKIAGPEAKGIINKFNKMVPWVAEVAKICTRRAEDKGYIITILGRRCRFPKREDGTYEDTHAAGNRLVQGSAGDQIKKSLVDCDEAGLNQQLQVHDELDMSTSKDHREANATAEIMRNSIKLLVPTKVDSEFGSSWGHSMG